MPANTQIPEHFPTEFSNNWEPLLQQKLSKLKEYVTVDQINGKEKTYNQIAATTMRLITSRSAATTAQDTATAKRWVRQQAYDAVDWFDEFDEMLLAQISLPNSEVIQNHASAYGRTSDQVIVAALGGTAYTGETGTTATTLPVAQKILSNYDGATKTLGGSGWGTTTGTVGLNVAKMIKAKSVLLKAEVDDTDLCLTVTQAQLDDLLYITQVTSADYAAVKALVDGKTDYFMGFKILRTEQHAAVASNIRKIYAYAKTGLIFTDAGRKVHVDVLPMQNHTLQIRTVASLGATRREEKKVVEIECYEA